ncbi:endoplasmic reticulum vesicle transporter-domain-containing protein [Zopfochytrium polystomum]|nr:endoplasmic reticulum vesicle transporter-domain-containing protein [Zopfochytrium polystomum]
MAVRRRTSSAAAAGGGGGFAALIERLSDLDAYARPIDDFRVKTLAGALVSIVSTTVIVLLLISEFVDWMSVQTRPSLMVDKARKEKMSINLNITFPKIPCPFLNLDVMDVAGEFQNYVDHSMTKSRIDRNGKVIGSSRVDAIGADASKPSTPPPVEPGYCGNCFGGQPPESGCCNTCDDLKKAYEAKGWTLSNPEVFEQSRRSWAPPLTANEGCTLTGRILVNKVAGNFHMAPGHSFQQQGGSHVHDLSGDVTALGLVHTDFSHVIHSLAFGDDIGGFVVNPLDGLEALPKEGTGPFMFQYYVKVVGTEFRYLNGTKVSTNQISVTEHSRDTSVAGMGVLPGVFFQFDISPLLITYNQTQKPFSHFLTDVCAVVGGVFVVAGMIDSIIYTAEKRFKQKLSLDK